jgi:hypothetical protein
VTVVLLHKTPDLIGLNIFDGNIFDFAVKQTLAFCASQDEQGKDRRVVNTCPVARWR